MMTIRRIPSVLAYSYHRNHSTVSTPGSACHTTPMRTAGLLESVDFFRLDANRRLDPDKRADFGQFMTPSATARLMASMFRADLENITLLDAGAGVGSLTAAFVDEICSRSQKPKTIHATAYEIDPLLVDYLHNSLLTCETACNDAGIRFQFDLINRDFIDEGARALKQEMFGPPRRYTCAIIPWIQTGNQLPHG